ncbi:ABC transporter permease [Corynebacterium sp. TAE3-ERU12]|uniref:ABC transporter permease n=1 Tax=Corynebacterium sp. TAE3-ERU12 TaxID=2849491 RepID=UPI001C482BB5|nr:ABC transporter permease [Corynebacterium sp. TAE3-ERU12]MBV7294445.1 ABC transporter permease [Corynebacterium sp. TAE3-ERU12]
MNPGGAVAAGWRRDTLRVFRNQAVMVSALIIPSLFVCAFYATFSLTAQSIGFNYANFLLPAGMIQATMFTAGGSALAVSLDAENGIHSRILTTQTPTWTIVAARLLADLTRLSWSGGVVIIVAMLLGARFEGGFWRTVALFGLFVVFAIVVSGCIDGACLLTKKPTSTAMLFQGMVLVIIMFSTAFVPAEALPDSIAPVITHVPLSPILDTARALMGDGDLGSTAIEAAAWLAIMTIIAIWGFTHALSRRNHV